MFFILFLLVLVGFQLLFEGQMSKASLAIVEKI
jgi:hypothetical protein